MIHINCIHKFSSKKFLISILFLFILSYVDIFFYPHSGYTSSREDNAVQHEEKQDIDIILKEAELLYSFEMYEDSFLLYMKAAKLGSPKGLYAVAYAYISGKGVKRNEDEAVKYFFMAADAGSADAQYFISTFLQYGTVNVDSYTDETFVDWLRKAANQGHPDAARALGVWSYYHYDEYGGLELLTQAAEKGDVFALYALVELYQERGEEGDAEEAFKWLCYLELSAPDGNVEYQLGNCYMEGNGVMMDWNKAIMMYKKAAANNNEDAQNKLLELGCKY